MTMLSPVWTPTGSKFSMEQTVMTLPLLSRITSNSISFQPAMLFSTRIWVIGESARPFAATSMSSSRLSTIPPPVPPSVNAGRMITGYVISSANSSASSTVVTTLDGMHG